MKSFDDAVALAEALVATGKRFEVQTQAVISDMSQPLGKYVGNALEVYECIKILRNEIEVAARPAWELSLELSARMLLLTGKSDDFESAKQICTSRVESGEALERLRLNVQCQGGDPSICDDPERLFSKEIVELPIRAETPGFLNSVDTQVLGNAVSSIGGGRIKADDGVDHAVGFSSELKIGDAVKAGDTIGVLYCRNADDAANAASKIREAYVLSESVVTPPHLIRRIIG